MNTFGPLQGTFIVLSIMQFAKWGFAYGNAHEEPWREKKKLGKYIWDHLVAGASFFDQPWERLRRESV